MGPTLGGIAILKRLHAGYPPPNLLGNVTSQNIPLGACAIRGNWDNKKNETRQL